MSTTDEELTALAALTFNWTRALDDVWTDLSYHVDGLHPETADLIRAGIGEASADSSRPLGIVIQGERGVGKTHLLGWTREQVQRAGGYFFLVGDLFTKAFWEQVLGSVVEQLLPLPDGSRDQLATLLTGLADRVGLTGNFRAQITGELPPSPEALKVFIAALRRTDKTIGLTCQDTARALALLASPMQEDQDVGYYYLTGYEVDLEDRRRWGIHATRKIPSLLVNEVSQLLALTGPIVIAIDQVDALIDELLGIGAGETPPLQSRPLADVSTGLMSLRDVAYRTLTVVSCLPESWEAIRDYGVGPVADRFRLARQMRNIPSADIGRLMIEKRFAADYARAGFKPPYPTWPILSIAFQDANRYTARALLKRIEAHVASCLQERAIVQLASLDPDWADSDPVAGTRGEGRWSRPRRRARPAWPPSTSCSRGCGKTPISAPPSATTPRTWPCRRCSRPASRPGPGRPTATTRRSCRTRCRAGTRGCTRACGCWPTSAPSERSGAGRSAPSPPATRTRCRRGCGRRSRGRPRRGRRGRRRAPAVRAQVRAVAERPEDREGGGGVRRQGRRRLADRAGRPEDLRRAGRAPRGPPRGAERLAARASAGALHRAAQPCPGRGGAGAARAVSAV